MPSYNFRSKETGEVVEKFLSISQREEFLAEGNWEQVHLQAPQTVSHTDGVLSKTDDSYRDLLKTIKKNSGRGNTIKI